jgi:hypothetical protein
MMDGFCFLGWGPNGTASRASLVLWYLGEGSDGVPLKNCCPVCFWTRLLELFILGSRNDQKIEIAITCIHFMCTTYSK